MTELNKLLSNKHFWSLVLALILGYCLITEYKKPTPIIINKPIKNYSNVKSTCKNTVSKEPKNTTTLEQEMVNKMVTTSQMNHKKVTPSYHPLLPNSAGASLVD